MKKKITYIVISLIIIISFFAFLFFINNFKINRSKDDTQANLEQNYSGYHHIILDTDTAGDDALAIALLAKAPNISLDGITVLAGNVNIDQAANNALMTLEIIGKKDIPVYKGAKNSLDGVERECFSVFGNDGMGDEGLIQPTISANSKNAIDYIIETVKKYPNEIEIMVVGPATNIALAIKKDPSIVSKVKCIWSMGTTGFGTGNATPVAEFNVYKDAKAYEILLNSGIPMKIIGLDICETEGITFNKQQIESISKVNKQGEFLAKSWNKLFNFKKKQGKDKIDLCDGVAAAAMIWPNFVNEETQCAAICITDDSPAYGQVMFYKKDYTYDSMPNVKEFNKSVVSKINQNVYYDLVMDILKK